MEIPLKYKQLWSDWDVRVLILLSLSIQIALIFLGRRRRTSTSRWIRGVVWCSYLLADWVADFVLGQLSSAMDDSSSTNAIIAFWAPFLILHLGGPDTITAYSMEDNELWGRHLLGLGYELVVAFYVLFRALPNTRLLTPTLLIFLVAIIKYLERSYSLYKASDAGFRRSISPLSRINIREDLNNLGKYFKLYSAIKPAFINVMSSIDLQIEVREVVDLMTAKEALRVTSLELSCAYDEFYTKAVVNHSKVGYIVRVLCTVCILLSFFLFISAPKNDFENVDIAITYVLLTASVCLDLVAIFMLVFSNWMVVSLLSVEKLYSWSMWFAERIVKFNIAFYRRRCWSMKISQLNIFDNILIIFEPKKSLRERIMNWVAKRLSFAQEMSITAMLKTYTLQTMQPVEATPEVMEFITFYMQSRISSVPVEVNEIADFSALQQVTTISVGAVPKFSLLFKGMPLDQQVLVWHIATELCLHESQHLMQPHRTEMEACKYMSNYMMHMMVMRPEMMFTMGAARSIFIGEFFKDMVEFISKKIDVHRLLPPNRNFKEVCMKMMIDQIDWKGTGLFVTAQVVARFMLAIMEEERWRVIAGIWVRLLIKLANNSRGSMHVKQLAMGEDLLTFAWLLSKHVELYDVMENLSFTADDRLRMARDLLREIQPHS